MRIHVTLKDTKIHKAVELFNKFILEHDFWEQLKVEIYKKHVTAYDDLVPIEEDILKHLRFMFTEIRMDILVVPYRTAWFKSSVLGHAEGATIFENMRKVDDLTLAQRVGHLAHEASHLLGYSHEYQGDTNSVPVIIGGVMGSYAKTRIEEMYAHQS